MPINPTDSGDVQLITNITNQLYSLISSNIGGVGRVYSDGLPDGVQEANSVVIPPPIVTVLEGDDTNGKVALKLNYSIIHAFRRSKLSEALSLAGSYMMPYILTFTEWSAQNLNGYSTIVNVKSARPVQVKEGNMPVVCCVVNLEIQTDFNALIP